VLNEGQAAYQGDSHADRPNGKFRLGPAANENEPQPAQTGSERGVRLHGNARAGPIRKPGGFREPAEQREPATESGQKP
jgi:hypothetical protein